MEPRIGILTIPFSRSSWVMMKFEEAGYQLGDVDRRKCDKYPAGRLELLPLCKARSGRDNCKSIKYPENLNLKGIQVLKVLPAWRDCLLPHITYWVGLERGPKNVRAWETDETLNTGNDFNPHEIWERAIEKLNQAT